MSVIIRREGLPRRPRFLPSAPALRRVAAAVLASEGIRRAGDITVVFAGRAAIRKANWAYLRHKGDTDVIAFSYPDSNDPGAPFADLYVCVPVAVENARRFADTPARELTRLVVHGLLHVLGYRDGGAAERKEMWARQEALVRRLAP